MKVERFFSIFSLAPDKSVALLGAVLETKTAFPITRNAVFLWHSKCEVCL
jgi:hypothetical protein